MGAQREVERGFVLMGVFIILDDFYHSTFRMRNSKSSKMKEEISQMKWCGLVILGVYSTSLVYIQSAAK